MGCASATLRLDLSGGTDPAARILEAERRLRDLRFNPQRHLDCGGELAALATARARAVEKSNRLRAEARADRMARWSTFEAIRSVSRQMVERRGEVLAGYQDEFDKACRALRDRQVASRRDYFIGLFGREDLQRVMDRLPGVARFRV